ncbi:hypothetical protein D3C86_2147130 [compost metagenome]
MNIRAISLALRLGDGGGTNPMSHPWAKISVAITTTPDHTKARITLAFISISFMVFLTG